MLHATLLYATLYVTTGTFSNVTGLHNVTQCQACHAGMHCNETGLAWPTGLCEAGFLCISGAMESAPDDGTNGPCPAGAYCEEGNAQPGTCIYIFRVMYAKPSGYIHVLIENSFKTCICLWQIVGGYIFRVMYAKPLGYLLIENACNVHVLNAFTAIVTWCLFENDPHPADAILKNFEFGFCLKTYVNRF